METDELKAEVERLREIVEAYKQRELDDLRTRLAVAEQAASHFKAEADRNANIARQIHAQYQEEVSRLRTTISASQTVPNSRSVPGGR